MNSQLLTWDIFCNLLIGLAKNISKTYITKKIIEEFEKKLKSHSGSKIEEQLILCMDGAIKELCQKYVVEYDIEMIKKVVYRLVDSKVRLSEKTFKDILAEAIDLEMDETVLEEWPDLVNKVIAEKQLTILRDYISLQSIRSAQSEKAYPRILTAKPALAPEEYLDREEKDIVFNKLKENKKLVLVNGMGGIGKSTVCRKLFHELAEKSDRTLAWIVYNKKDLREDFEKQMFFPKEGNNWEKRFIKFLQQDIETEAIVFIDNLDVSEEEEPFLNEIANANCSIICTSRITDFHHYEVVPVSFFTIEDCVQLFYSYYRLEYDRKRIINIVSRAGRHTLVIEILAKIGNAEGYTLQKLQEILNEQGFDLEGIASVGMKEDTLIGHLCKTFNTQKMNQQQKAFLYCLAVLPVQRIPLALKNWLKLPNSYNINYLKKRAWFLKDAEGFYMHPVIKEVVKKMIEPQQQVLKDLLKSFEGELSFKENPKYEKSMEIISYVEAVLPFLDDISEMPQLLYNVSMLYGQFGVYEKALEYVSQCIKIIELQEDDSELLGSAYNHEGYIYYYIFEDEKAEESYKKAYSIRKKLKNKKLLAQTVTNLGLLYQGMWKTHKEPISQEAIKLLEASAQCQQEAIGIFEEIFDGKMHPNLASAYNNMAELQNSLHRFEDAEYYFNKAATIRIQLSGESAAGDLSVTYLGLGKNYKNMAENSENIKERKHFFELALDSIKKCRTIRVSEIRKGNQKLGIEPVIELQNELEQKLQICKL